MTAADDPVLRIGLAAVVMTLSPLGLCVLTTGQGDELALPAGPFDPGRDRTFELSLRAFVEAQTGFRPGFVEQLYTFGDAGRGAPSIDPNTAVRDISVGYLALTREVEAAAKSSRWTPVFDLFPWEDAREPEAKRRVLARLSPWAGVDARRRARIETLFPSATQVWDEERALDRYELLYEARLVPEAARDHGDPAIQDPGRSMVSDHRRILATGLGRLRSKLKYRPVLFDLMPDSFTLSQLQAAAEAISGLALHKQNFRRGVERTDLIEPTGRMSALTGGRPAECYRLKPDFTPDGRARGLALPARR